MATYTVIDKGTHGNVYYTPGGKRPTLTVAKPFKVCPSWLEPVKEASKAKPKDASKAKVAPTDAQNATDVAAATFINDSAATQVVTV